MRVSNLQLSRSECNTLPYLLLFSKGALRDYKANDTCHPYICKAEHSAVSKCECDVLPKGIAPSQKRYNASPPCNRQYSG